MAGRQESHRTSPPVEEGVVQFTVDHRDRPLSPRRYGALAAELASWRSIFAALSLVGQRADRYDGAGYGNVSGRVGPFPGSRGARPFLVSGSQTGGLSCVTLSDFALVSRYSAERNHVISEGPLLPSSESMTHGALYDLGPQTRFVFHVHCPLIWRSARALRIPVSASGVPYGTPGMAREIMRLARETALLEGRILAMGGHEDGVITFGHTPSGAGRVLLEALAAAHRETFTATGRACAQDGSSRLGDPP